MNCYEVHVLLADGPLYIGLVYAPDLGQAETLADSLYAIGYPRNAATAYIYSDDTVQIRELQAA
jgi:hypothetical protein